MGFFDRFRKPFERVGKDRKVKHAVEPRSSKAKAESEQKRQFANVPGGKPVAKKPDAAKAKQPEKRSATGSAHRVLRTAVVSEKSSRLSGMNQVVFEVAPSATKHAVAEAIRDLYGFAPVSVRVINVRGKFIRYGRSVGRTKERRKAIVSVPEGKRITVAEGV